MANTSGQGKEAEVPEEVRGLCWGAFFWTFIWGIFNRVWISFATFIPIVGIVVWIVLLFKGREWAWKSKEWESPEQFNKVQRLWGLAGLVFVVLIFGGMAVMVAFFGMQVDSFGETAEAPPPKVAVQASKSQPAAAQPAAPQPAAPQPAPAQVGAPAKSDVVAKPPAAPPPAPQVVAAAGVAAEKPGAAALSPAQEAKLREGEAKLKEVPDEAPKPAAAAAAKADSPPAPRKPAAKPRSPAARMAAGTDPAAPAGGPMLPGPKYNDLMTAVVFGDQPAVLELIEFGKYVDKRDENGNTPLLIAISRGYHGIAQLLLERRADPNANGAGGMTPLDWAKKRNDPQAIALLQKYGAR